MVRHAPRYRRAASLSLFFLSTQNRTDVQRRDFVCRSMAFILHCVQNGKRRRNFYVVIRYKVELSYCLNNLFRITIWNVFASLSLSVLYEYSFLYFAPFFLVGSSFSWSSGSSYWFMCKLFVLCRWSFFQSVVSCNLRRSRQYKHCIFYFYVDFNGYNSIKKMPACHNYKLSLLENSINILIRDI